MAERTPGLYATLLTNQGTIVCRLFEKEAPKTVENFVELAEGKREWKDSVSGKKVPARSTTEPFSPLISDFMIQGGFPAAQAWADRATSSEMRPRVHLSSSMRLASLHGELRPQHEWFAVLHHCRPHAVAYGQPHHLRRSRRGTRRV